MSVEQEERAAKALRLRTGVIALLAAINFACSSWQTVATPSPEAYLSAEVAGGDPGHATGQFRGS